MASLDPDGVQAQHLQIEALKLAFADAGAYVGGATRPSDSVAMLDGGYLRSRARLIDRVRAQDFGAGNPVNGGTIYLTAADE
jgi:gamma-glutamyltranspeptidase/glutathione hydrolase